MNKIQIMQYRLIGIEETAKCLGLNKQTLYNWISQKKIEYIKIRGAIRFDVAKLEEWIKQSTIDPQCTVKNKSISLKIQPKTKNGRVKKVKPAFGTNEWSVATLNFLNGCSNNCKYCYARYRKTCLKTKTTNNWKTEVLQKTIPKKYKKYEGTVMFPSTHDITLDHLNESLLVIERILQPGNDILLVSKPRLECIKAICEKFKNYKSKILFRFTIGSADSKVLKFWEPKAPDFNERLSCLKYNTPHNLSQVIR